jgi:hypothetical protein
VQDVITVADGRGQHQGSQEADELGAGQRCEPDASGELGLGVGGEGQGEDRCGDQGEQ